MFSVGISERKFKREANQETGSDQAQRGESGGKSEADSGLGWILAGKGTDESRLRGGRLEQLSWVMRACAGVIKR